MRTYDDPVEVRKRDDDPDQFLWRGKLWQVRAVVSHWVETGSWWVSTDGDLLAERDLWRVEAGRGPEITGVFDLCFDWSTGDWHMAGAVD